MNTIYPIAIKILFTIWLLPSIVFAGDIPQSAEPGRHEERFKQSRKLKSLPVVVFDQHSVDEAASKEKLFSLKRISIHGATIYNEKQLQEYWSSQVGEQVSLFELNTIARKITKRYVDDGYTLSHAYVPTQEIKDGFVVINIIEGYIDNVKVSGTEQKHKAIVKLFNEKVADSKPLYYPDLERLILLTHDLYGIKAKVTLKAPKDDQSGSTLILNLIEKKNDASFDIDNRGIASMGPVQLIFSGSLNNQLNHYERFKVDYTQTSQIEELKYLVLRFDYPILKTGTNFSLSSSHSRSKPGTAILRNLALDSKSDSIRFDMSHPIIRSRSENFSVRAGVNYKDSRDKLLGIVTSRDKIRSLRLGVDYDKTDVLNGTNHLSLEVSKGLDILNAIDESSTLKSRAGGTSDYTKITFDASRTQQLPKNFSALLSSTGQWAAQQLLSAEECGIGGQLFGRGYDSSEITGDHCLAVSMEVRFLSPRKINYLDYLQLYTFYDIGKVWNINPTTGINRNNSLASTGLGMRFGLLKDVSMSFELTKPLTRPVSELSNLNRNAKKPRYFLNLSWSY